MRISDWSSDVCSSDLRRSDGAEDISPYAFPGRNDDKAFGSFPRYWEKIFKGPELEDVTAHVLRHSFATMPNDLGFTEITIAALLGHAEGSTTCPYVPTLDSALILAAATDRQCTPLISRLS